MRDADVPNRHRGNGEGHTICIGEERSSDAGWTAETTTDSLWTALHTKDGLTVFSDHHSDMAATHA